MKISALLTSLLYHAFRTSKVAAHTVITVTLLFALTGNHAVAEEPHAAHAIMTGSSYAPFQAEMHAQMKKMNDDMTSAPMTGDPDIDFAVMMIPHHQGAIDMARTQLKYGKDEKLRAMAEKIIKAQEEEIAELQERVKQLKESDKSSSGSQAKESGHAHH